jgi:hypothetical protein
LSHLFNSISIAPIDTCVVEFTWVFLNSVYALVKHKDFINYVLLSSILSNHYDLFPLSSQIHILQSTILLPYLFHHNIFMFMLYYFRVIALYVELHILLREVKDLGLQKGKWHTYPLPIFTTSLVFFSRMHDRWNIQLFYKLLDPSSV